MALMPAPPTPRMWTRSGGPERSTAGMALHELGNCAGRVAASNRRGRGRHRPPPLGVAHEWGQLSLQAVDGELVVGYEHSRTRPLEHATVGRLVVAGRAGEGN